MQVQARKNPVELQTSHLLITVWMIIFAASRLSNSLTSATAEWTVSIKAELEPVVLVFFTFTITGDASHLSSDKSLLPAKSAV